MRVCFMFKTFKEAKKQADKIGGVVTWWCSYSVHPAKDYNQATCGTAKYVSAKAVKFFHARYMKELKRNRRQLKLFRASFKKNLTKV